jgi:hypothetical protein
MGGLFKMRLCLVLAVVFMCTGCSHLIQAYNAIKPHYVVFSEVLGFVGDNSTHVYHSAQNWEDAHSEHPEQTIEELEEEVNDAL